MQKHSSFYEFLNGLEDNFRYLVQYFRTFNFGNFGTYLAYLLLSGIAALIVVLIWSYLLSIIKGMPFELADVEDWTEYLSFFKYSRLIQGVGVLTIGLFAMMLSPFNTKKAININMLFSSISPEMWRNFAICVGIYLALSVFIPESFMYSSLLYYDLTMFDMHGEIGGSLKGLLYNLLNLLFIILPYFLASLCVQLGSSKFTPIPKGRLPQVFSGMLLLMIFMFAFDYFAQTVGFYLVGLFSILLKYVPALVLLSTVTVIFFGVILLPAKARALGVNDNITSSVASEEIADTDILDDEV